MPSKKLSWLRPMMVPMLRGTRAHGWTRESGVADVAQAAQRCSPELEADHAARRDDGEKVVEIEFPDGARDECGQNGEDGQAASPICFHEVAQHATEPSRRCDLPRARECEKQFRTEMHRPWG